MNNAILGWEFEFYSNDPIEYTKLKLESKLNKTIKIFDEGHSDFKPTNEIFKLERDYSGGKKMMELVTPPLPLNESINIMYLVLE